MWFDVRPHELSWSPKAPWKLQAAARIAASPERLFDMLASAEGMREWAEDFVSCRWLSEPPHGPGSLREMLYRTMAVRERVVAWEPGRRLGLAVFAMTAPLVKDMVHELCLEPSGDGASATSLRWAIHYAPSRALRWLHPLSRAVFERMLQANVKGLALYVESRRARAA